MHCYGRLYVFLAGQEFVFSCLYFDYAENSIAKSFLTTTESYCFAAVVNFNSLLLNFPYRSEDYFAPSRWFILEFNRNFLKDLLTLFYAPKTIARKSLYRFIAFIL